MMQSKRFLNSVALPLHVQTKLLDAGFKVVDDLRCVCPLALSKEADISYAEAAKVFELAFPAGQSATGPFHYSVGMTAFELLQQEQDQMNIVTFSHSVDKILGGGIPLGKTSEICGAPGTGKTQLCIQLCVDVQIPERLGGVGGEAVFIDTEGSFSVERLVDMAQGWLLHCQKNPTLKDNLDVFTVDGILRGVHYYRCCDYLELVALINMLPDFLQKHTKVRLVVIDSIAFHFRFGFEGSYVARGRILSNLSQALVRIAFESQLAVVLTNQMTTRFDAQGQNGLVPALGEGWSHMCALRLVLHWWEGQRRALLAKSPSLSEDVAVFQIMSAGIRDVVDKVTCSTDDLLSSPQSLSKRPKLNS